MEIKIYGSSDDLVVINGDIIEEFYFNDRDDNIFLFISDGTLIQVLYGDHGIWRFLILHKGSCEVKHDPNPITDDERYSDIITMNGDIIWVALGTQYVVKK